MARTKRQPNPNVCCWEADEDAVYQTTCGHAFFFDTDGPVENQFKFCGYCGGALKAKPVAMSSRLREAASVPQESR